MFLDLREIKKMKIVTMKKKIHSIDLWCNQDNSTHVHPITNHRHHLTSKNILTLHTKVLVFVLLIISLTQYNDLCLHFDTRSQNNKTQSTMSALFLFFFMRGIDYSHYSSIEYHSTPTTTTKYVLSLNYT